MVDSGTGLCLKFVSERSIQAQSSSWLALAELGAKGITRKTGAQGRTTRLMSERHGAREIATRRSGAGSVAGGVVRSRSPLGAAVRLEAMLTQPLNRFGGGRDFHFTCDTLGSPPLSPSLASCSLLCHHACSLRSPDPLRGYHWGMCPRSRQAARSDHTRCSA